MKKLLSFLVLMLIALTLFIGCENNTPTKDNSGNGGTNTPVEKPEDSETPETPTDPEAPGNPGEGTEEPETPETPETPEEPREANDTEKAIFNTLFTASMSAIMNNVNGVEFTSQTDASFTNVIVDNIKLCGSASMDNIMKLDLTDGTEIDNNAHKMYCEGTRNESGMITVTKFILDDQELTGIGPISLE